MRTFYGINFWLKDSSDFRDIDGYTTLKQALVTAKRLENKGKGYHTFTIYAYHAELIDDDFEENGIIYHRQKWQTVDDDFDKCYDIDGKLF